MSSMFQGCFNLIQLPEISSWDTKNVKNFSYMFCNCSSLKSLPDISKWNTSNATNLSYMFHNCSNLIKLPNISEWDISNVKFISYMFYNCSSLNNLPDISRWNCSNIIDYNMIFFNCSSLTLIPEFSENKFIISEKKEEIINDNEKIELKGEIRNELLDFIPQIELKFNSIDLFDSKTIFILKKEIKKILKNDNFSIIEVKKGSLSLILALQYLILKGLRNLDNTNVETLADMSFDDINPDIEKISQELKSHEFISLGTLKPDFVNDHVIDLNDSNNKEKLKDKILEISEKNKNNDKINFYESTKNIKKEDLEQFFQKLSIDADNQENNNVMRLINRLDEFNKVFDEEIENALKNSVFEYKIIHIVLVEKESGNFKNEKQKCLNRVDRMLFHGTKASFAVGIVSSNFKPARTHQIGKGVYMTDSLDYMWYYAYDEKERRYIHINIIPKIDQTFNFVVSQIFYDKSKFEYVYNTDKKEFEVEDNGIRCAYDNYNTRVLNEMESRNYKQFYGKEFVISNSKQILPLYIVTMKRVEYLVIWRDYNFDINNPNNYDQITFKEMQDFHQKIKSFITKELNSKIYYINNNEQALKLLDRKKYNKIIIITNGNNDGEQFIHDSRNIIGAEALAAVSAYDVSKHIQWVKNLNNVLILNGIDFHKKFFRCIINNDTNLFRQLKNEIIQYYNDIPGFQLKENINKLFHFPNFKKNGKFGELSFNYML